MNKIKVLTDVVTEVEKVKFIDQVKEQPILFGTALVVVGLVVAVVVLSSKKANKKKKRK